MRGSSAFQGMTPGILGLSAAFSFLLLIRQNIASFLAGLHDFWNRNLVWASTPGIVAALLVLNVALQGRLTPSIVLGMYVAAAGFAVAYGVIVCGWRHGVQPERSEEGASQKEFLKYGSKFYLGYMAQTLNYRLDSFLVNAMRGVRDVGLYATVVGASELLLLVPTAVNVVMYPTIASLNGRQRDRVAVVSTGMTLYAVVAAGILWQTTAGWLIPLVFGGKFAESVVPARWLVPGMAAIAVVRVLCHAAAASGRPEVLTYTTFAGLAFTVPLDFLLIPRWGITGASLASSIAYSVSALMAVRLYAGMMETSFFSMAWRLLREPATVFLGAARGRGLRLRPEAGGGCPENHA